MIILHLMILSLNQAFKLQDIFKNFIVSSEIKQHSLQDLSKTAGKSLQAKITENTKSTWTTTKKIR